MVKSEKNSKNVVWLNLPGYHVVALKPEFAERTGEVESAILRGLPAYPDRARPDFYDVVLEDGWAYIHVFRGGRTVYLIAYSLSTFGPSSKPIRQPGQNDLLAVGMEPSDREVFRATIVEPVLSLADSEGLPCYVETFNPENLPFYKKLGFRIEGAGRIPGGPNFWSMVRRPQMQSKVG